MASSKITKKIVTEKLEEKRKAHKEVKEFITRLETTLQLKNRERQELEGAILILHELLTGEKVK